MVFSDVAELSLALPRPTIYADQGRTGYAGLHK